MPTYGKVKVDTITYDLSGTATDVSVSNIATKASPTFTGTINAANLILSGDLTVNGTTTTIDTTTLQVEDKNIEIGKVSSPSDTTADGGGLTLLGATNKTWNWVNSTDSWTSSEHIHLGDNKQLKLGSDTDFYQWHDGSNAYVRNTTGSFFLEAKSGENALVAIPDAEVQLYHNNVKTLATEPNGIFVYGPEGGSAVLRLYADEGDDNADRWRILNDHSSSNNLTIQNYSTGSWVSGLTLDSSNNATFAGTVSDSKGDLRKIIQNTQGSAYTLVASDAGKHILASGNITIPNSVFAAGDGVVIVNNTSGDLTITSGITNLYLGTDGSTGNKTLASRCTCTVLFTSGTAGYISGGGLS